MVNPSKWLPNQPKIPGEARIITDQTAISRDHTEDRQKTGSEEIYRSVQDGRIKGIPGGVRYETATVIGSASGQVDFLGWIVSTDGSCTVTQKPGRKLPGQKSSRRYSGGQKN